MLNVRIHSMKMLRIAIVLCLASQSAPVLGGDSHIRRSHRSYPWANISHGFNYTPITVTDGSDKPWSLFSALGSRINGVVNKRSVCGDGFGSCPRHQCCLRSGVCGDSAAFCEAPACWVEYSNGNCQSE